MVREGRERTILRTLGAFRPTTREALPVSIFRLYLSQSQSYVAQSSFKRKPTNKNVCLSFVLCALTYLLSSNTEMSELVNRIIRNATMTITVRILIISFMTSYHLHLCLFATTYQQCWYWIWIKILVRILYWLIFSNSLKRW